MINKIFFLWNLIIILFNLVNGYENDNLQIDNESVGDNYYMIFVNNGNINNLKKREETDKLINEFVNEIQNLIVENKETYEDPIKLAEIENSARFRKRSDDNSDTPSLVYSVSTVDDSTVLYAYLSGNIAAKVENLDYVESLSPDSYTELATGYNIDDIKNETNWKDVSVKEYTYMHLSLLSQGNFSLKHIGEYDYNYYFPSSAGQDVDIVIMDSGFNFNYSEYSNKENRITECKVYIKDGEKIEITDGNCKTKDQNTRFHGECVSDAAGGLDRGVASNANIYGVQLDVSVNSIKDIDILGGLKYISEHLVRPNKTIINLSFGKYFSYTNKTDELIHYEKLINEITDKGGIIISAAGNRNSATVSELSEEAFYPCSFENVICVGGVDVMDPSVSNEYKKANDCNYGDNIDIYAPYDMDLLIQQSNGQEVEISVEGTSFSSPLVVGVAATLISEHPEMEFNTSKMLNYLTDLGLKDVIKGISKGKGNVFVNNGKHIVYSSDDVYYGCGVLSGNRGCSSNEICSDEGFCSIPSFSLSLESVDTSDIPSATETSVIAIPSTYNDIINNIIETTVTVVPTTITTAIINSTHINEIPITVANDYTYEEETDTPVDVGDVDYEEEEDEDYIEEEYLLKEDEEEDDENEYLVEDDEDDDEDDEAIDLDLYLDDDGNELSDNTIRRKMNNFYKKYLKSQWNNLFKPKNKH